MEHLRFKSSQTPAVYVAGGLDSKTQEAFEMHLMSCPECVDEVEAWRTVKDKIVEDTGERRREPMVTAPPVGQPSAIQRRSALAGWRLAASVAALTCAGAAGGWYARSAQGPWMDTDSVGFYSLPVRMRGPADCLSLHLDGPIKLVAVRVPGAAPEEQLVAVDGSGRDLSPDSYAVRTQTDGSWLVRLGAPIIREQGVRFEARSADGTADPRGCVLSSAKG
jgi:hypothetical protein